MPKGVTTAVAGLYEAINAERVAVAAGVGPRFRPWPIGSNASTAAVRRRSSRHASSLPYNSDGPYQATGTPNSLDHKFMTEDVPTGLIPMSALGAAAGTAPANRAAKVSSSAILFAFTNARAVRTPAALYWRSRAQPPTEHPP